MNARSLSENQKENVADGKERPTDEKGKTAFLITATELVKAKKESADRENPQHVTQKVEQEGENGVWAIANGGSAKEKEYAQQGWDEIEEGQRQQVFWKFVHDRECLELEWILCPIALFHLVFDVGVFTIKFFRALRLEL